MNDETVLVMYYQDNGLQVVLETYFPETLIEVFKSIGVNAVITPF